MTRAGCTYHHLTSADVSLLKDLLRVFGEAFNDVATYQHAVPRDDYLVQLLGKPHFIAVVALSDRHVVGGLVAYAGQV
jgi:aminoglycoside 3-N-acetyltransferase I